MADCAFVGQANAAGSSTTPAATRSVTAGNVIVAMLAHASGTESISDTAGNTWTLQVTQTTTGRSVIWTAIANATGSTTVNITKGTSGAWVFCVAEASGADPTSPVTATGGTSNASGTSKAMAASAISVSGGGIFFGGCYLSGTPTSVVATTGTLVFSPTSRGVFIYRVNAAGFSEGGDFTHATASTGAGASVAIQKVVTSGLSPIPFIKNQAPNRASTY